MRSSLYRKARMLAGRLVFRLLDASAALIPLPIARAIGARLGDLIYLASARYRRMTIANLTAAYDGQMSSWEVRRTARQVFRHFARGTVEFFYLLRLKPEQLEQLIDLKGTEHIDAALKRGNGCVLLTGHLGHWEMLARRLASAGYKINVIARDSDDVVMTGIARRIREGAGYRVLGRNPREAFRVLKNNEILGILPDQNAVGGIKVDFFGQPAATAEGPAVFSLKTGAPIVPAFARRGKDGMYHAVIHPPIEIPLVGNRDDDVRRLTQALTKRIEEEIREDPTQWLWLHDRWKRWNEAYQRR